MASCVCCRGAGSELVSGCCGCTVEVGGDNSGAAVGGAGVLNVPVELSCTCRGGIKLVVPVGCTNGGWFGGIEEVLITVTSGNGIYGGSSVVFGAGDSGFLDLNGKTVSSKVTCRET